MILFRRASFLHKYITKNSRLGNIYNTFSLYNKFREFKATLAMSSYQSTGSLSHNRESEIFSNLDEVSKNIQNCSPTSTAKVRLVAVSKTKPSSDVQLAYSWGQRHFGENYVQELVQKSQELPKDILWHFIGALQSKKCKILAGISNLWAVETLSSIKHANSLQEHRANLNYPTLNVFVQVNTSGEDSKSGLSPKGQELTDLCKHIVTNCPNLKLLGLMTIGSINNSSGANSDHDKNPDFECLNDCKRIIEEELSLEPLELSMGMSMDYQSAIRAGSTSVRVGSTLFGSRAPKPAAI